jgi:dienelactone hydrolase
MIERVELRGRAPGILLLPPAPPLAGVLVLAGSSGRVDVPRAALCAGIGAVALALQWFGGEGQSKGICEVPLETFVAGVDALEHAGASRVLVVGVSKGAEAALHLAVLDDRVDGVIAMSPSSVTWANVGPGLDGRIAPYRSSWSWREQPLPFVPYDPDWVDPPPPVSYLPLYEASLARFPSRVADARIPIERARAHVVCVAGGDDRVWPSLAFARELEAARQGRRFKLLTGARAGHRLPFPTEVSSPERARQYLYGGSEVDDRRLGAAAWAELVAMAASA